MATVKVKARGELVRVWIDGSRVVLDGSVGSRNVKPGEHVISWFVRGAPGSLYSVQIASPPGAQFKKEARLDGTQQDAGLHWFTIS